MTGICEDTKIFKAKEYVHVKVGILAIHRLQTQNGAHICAEASPLPDCMGGTFSICKDSTLSRQSSVLVF